jgi:uncharacterized protein with NRDE domain
MCTILALFRVNPEFPLVIAANRDEYYERPSSGPRALSGHPRSIGGLDLREGGTWMGASTRGFFIGVTNQRTHQLPDHTLRSRGQAVRQLLGTESVSEVCEQLGRLDPAQYNPFNLLFGDADALYVAYARRDLPRITVEPLPGGIHVLPNDRLCSPDFPRAVRARQLAEEVCEQPWSELRGSLADVLSDHRLPPIEEIPAPPASSIFTREQLQRLQAICIHAEVYGTCSATLMALKGSAVAHYLYAPGPPCQSPFQEVTPLLTDS